MENQPSKLLKTFSVKTEQDTIDRFHSLKEQSGVSTDSQFLEAVLDRFEQPQRLQDRTDQLQQRIDELTQLLDAQQQTGRQLQAQLDEAQRQAATDADAATLLRQQSEQRIAQLTPADNQALITFSPDNLRVLDLVCTRESQRRHQQWSRSHVINYFINARFVRGLLNGDLQSVPDADLWRLGINVGGKGKEDFEL
ncbi:MAG: hypothetical protein IJU81_02595 [Bacteroidales bacterium]|nr:hypothetical protein [Bacteroidales bacterium]